MHENSIYNRRRFLSTAAQTGTAIVAGAHVLSSSLSAQVVSDVAAPNIARFKTLLIFDRDSVAAADQVTFHLNQAKKHPENPLLIPGEPHEWDSLQVVWPGTVLYDADDKLFRCWYNGLDVVQAGRAPIPWFPGYAESTDGIHWTKPDLGQYSHNGFPTNRFKLDWPQAVAGTYHNLSLVVKNPDQSDPQRKFLSLWQMGAGPQGMQKILASSPDGKTWKQEGVAFESVDGSPANFLDCSSVVFQPEAANENERVLVYGQLWAAVREIGCASGASLSSYKFSGDRGPDWWVLQHEKGIDEEVHFASVKKFGDLFVMLFESDRFSHRPLHGDLRVAISTDGKKFRRVHPNTPLVATGSRGTWDENLLVITTSAMQEVGDEIWIYHFGCPNVFTQWPGAYAKDGSRRGSMFYPTYLGVATLPRDRFAYAAGPGSVTTSTLSIGEQGLWLNADGEGLSVTAAAPAGGTLAEGKLVDAPKPSLYRKVQWTGEAPRQPCQLKVALANDQRIYSLRY